MGAVRLSGATWLDSPGVSSHRVCLSFFGRHCTRLLDPSTEQNYCCPQIIKGATGTFYINLPPTRSPNMSPPAKKTAPKTIGRQGCRSHPTKEWEIFVLTGAVVCFSWLAAKLGRDFSSPMVDRNCFDWSPRESSNRWPALVGWTLECQMDLWIFQWQVIIDLCQF